jgi:hypothetical protein
MITVSCQQRVISLFSVAQLALFVMHQHTVKIGQPPFLVNERSHRPLSSKNNLAFRVSARQINKFFFLGLLVWHRFSSVSA